MKPYILISNPGSASRKYAVFKGTDQLAHIHFEWQNGKINCTLNSGGSNRVVSTKATNLQQTPTAVANILADHNILEKDKNIEAIGVRIVAPGQYFLSDHKVTDTFIKQIKSVQNRAPIHINATLLEIEDLKNHFVESLIVGISDSGFHNSKPHYAQVYGISPKIADEFEIKRFGYHGLSVESVIKQKAHPTKVIVCHLGSGSSITAVLNGQSIDTTMGYSPLEGLIMGTRSGSIDIEAVDVIKKSMNLSDVEVQKLLNEQSGLLALGGTADIRQLLKLEAEGSSKAKLALESFVYSIQKGIGQMAAALNGVDALYFTGTIGERSAPIRRRVLAKLGYLGFFADHLANVKDSEQSSRSFNISSNNSKLVSVVPAQEEKEMAEHVYNMFKSE